MRTAFLIATVALGVAGCHHAVVVNGSTERVVVVDESSAWDGHVFVTIRHHQHGPGCGHFMHHGQWHLYSESHVYATHGDGYYGFTVSGPEPVHHDPPRKPGPPRKP